MIQLILDSRNSTQKKLIGLNLWLSCRAINRRTSLTKLAAAIKETVGEAFVRVESCIIEYPMASTRRADCKSLITAQNGLTLTKQRQAYSADLDLRPPPNAERKKPTVQRLR